MITYKVVRADSIFMLEAEVNRYLTEGWYTKDNVVFCPARESHYLQVMLHSTGEAL